MKAWIAAGALLCVACSGASAESRTYGLGNRGCGKFIAAADAARKGHNAELETYLQWTFGYMTLASTVTGLDYMKQGRDRESLTLWLQNYCNANPLEDYFSATVHLLDALKTTK